MTQLARRAGIHHVPSLGPRPSLMRVCEGIERHFTTVTQIPSRYGPLMEPLWMPNIQQQALTPGRNHGANHCWRGDKHLRRWGSLFWRWRFTNRRRVGLSIAVLQDILRLPPRLWLGGDWAQGPFALVHDTPSGQRVYGIDQVRRALPCASVTRRTITAKPQPRPTWRATGPNADRRLRTIRHRRSGMERLANSDSTQASCQAQNARKAMQATRQ